MNKANDNGQFNVRLSIVYLLVAAAFVVVLVRAVYLKTAEKDFWVSLEQQRILRDKELLAKRGDIYAIDSESGEYLLLATTEPQYDVYVDLGGGKVLKKGKETFELTISEQKFNEGLNGLCDSLSKMLSYRSNAKSSAYYRKYFKQKRKQGRRYVLVAQKVPQEELERMKTFPVIGYKNKKKKRYAFVGAVHYEEGYKRVYPYFPMARRTIGINVTNNGCDTCYNGIDGAFSKYLTGIHGTRKERKINKDEWVPIDVNEKIKTIDGYDVVTTLDVSLQELAENSLRSCLDSNDAESGCVVLMEVETGYVRAISSLTLNKDGEYVENDNIAISHSFEPGSTFKIVTAMMLLDKGFADISDSVPTGVKYFNGSEKPIRDVGEVNRGLVSFERALEISSNVGISQLVYNIYGRSDRRKEFRKDLMEYFRFERLNMDIDVHEPAPKIKSSENMTDLLRMSFGYVSSVTPLQMLTFYNAIANNGKMVKPMFVQSIISNGKEIERFEPEVINEKICKQETRDKIHNVLKGVVQNGTGRRLKSASYGIAGKSGTAEIGYEKKNASIQHRASFVGYFPADSPKYSCIVVISRPQKNRTHGGDLAAPVFRDLSDRVVGTRIDFNNISRNDSLVQFPIIRYGNNKDFVAFCKSLGLIAPSVNAQWVRGKEFDGKCVLREQKLSDGIVPNVVGLSIKDAVYMLENMGMRVRFSGKGKVVKQSVAAGSKIDKKHNLIVLELQTAGAKTNKTEK